MKLSNHININISVVVENEQNAILVVLIHAKGLTLNSGYNSAIPMTPGLTHNSPFIHLFFGNSPCSDMYESISKR